MGFIGSSSVAGAWNPLNGGGSAYGISAGGATSINLSTNISLITSTGLSTNTSLITSTGRSTMTSLITSTGTSLMTSCITIFSLGGL
jgi:hypothetical protein